MFHHDNARSQKYFRIYQSLYETFTEYLLRAVVFLVRPLLKRNVNRSNKKNGLLYLVIAHAALFFDGRACLVVFCGHACLVAFCGRAYSASMQQKQLDLEVR